jgi:hypothetical protein
MIMDNWTTSPGKLNPPRGPEHIDQSRAVMDVGKVPKRPNSTIAGGVGETTTGDDCHRYFQRKSQIFGEDCASRAT